MSASYPSSPKTFVSRNAGDVIQPAHINDLQDEVNAVETALLGTIAHNVTISGVVSVTGFGTHTFSGGGTPTNALAVRNTTAGTGNDGRLIVGNDADANLVSLVAYSSTFTTSGAFKANGALLFAEGAGGLTLSASHAAGFIDLYTAGVVRGRMHASGGFSWGSTTDPGTAGWLTATIFLPSGSNGVSVQDSGFFMGTWPTTASAANANVVDGAALKRVSSLRLIKHDIHPIAVEDARRTVAGLAPVLYRSRVDEDQRQWAGFIADDVAEVNPVLASYGVDGALQSVTYDRVPAYLVTVVKDLMEQVSILKARISALEAAR